MKTGSRAWANVLGWITGIGATLAALIVFINGLTDTQRTVVVGLGKPASIPVDARIHNASMVTGTAYFSLSDIQGADRILNGLGPALVLLVLAAVGFALVGQTHVTRSWGARWFFARSQFSTALGLSLIALGVIPTMVDVVWVSLTLWAAGSPGGVTAVAEPELSWIILGLMYLAAVRAVAPPPVFATGPHPPRHSPHG